MCQSLLAFKFPLGAMFYQRGVISLCTFSHLHFECYTKSLLCYLEICDCPAKASVTASIWSPYLHFLSRLPALWYICPSSLQLLSLQRLSVVFFLIWIWDLPYDDSRTSETLLNLEVIQPLVTALITQTGMKAVFPTNFTAEVITARSFLGVLLSSDKHKKFQTLTLKLGGSLDH